MLLNNFETEKMFFYENGFYTTITENRLGKLLAQYELYKKIINLPGDVIECGVFKGNSFFRLAHFRDILESKYSRKIIGFDVFGKFPESSFEKDKAYLEKFINSAGADSIEIEEIEKILSYKKIENYELVKGNILETIPEYCKRNPHLRIALLHIDVDVYDPTIVILENLYEKVVRGGVIMLDDYGVFPGETEAVEQFFKDKKVIIQKLPISHVPSFVIKP